MRQTTFRSLHSPVVREVASRSSGVSSEPYWLQIDLKRLFFGVAGIVGLVALGSVHRFSMLGVLLLLCGFAVGSSMNAIRALSVLFLLIYINPVVSIGTEATVIMRWLVYFGACGRILHDALTRPRFSLFAVSPIRWMLSFCAVAFFCNVVANPLSPVGYLKIFALALGTTCIFAGVALNAARRDELFRWMLALTLAILAMSIPFLPLDAGYFSQARNALIAENGVYAVFDDVNAAGGFMGILGHSQAFGVVVGLLSTFMLAALFFTRYRPKWIFILLLLLSTAMLFRSQARGGTLAFLLTLAGMALLAPILAGAGRKLVKGVRVPLLPIIAVAIVVAIAALSFADGESSNVWQRFISKGRDQNISLAEAYQNSRGNLIQLSFDNFKNHPIFGIGFGRSSWEAAGFAQETGRGGLVSLAFAPTEKGMIFSAALEEMGLVGCTAFVLMLGAFAWSFLQQGNVLGVGLLAVVLLLNFGEMSLFSMGGLGTLEWVCIAMGGALASAGRPPRHVDGRAGHPAFKPRPAPARR